eukprot:GEMP01018730.1.p1 GENE.GEMP01018730.1~~GEMP01018730.1.p1  ORF type:complete len:464 (+),score=105.63 GEMP01018730.1:166-1557(+)
MASAIKTASTQGDEVESHFEVNDQSSDAMPTEKRMIIPVPSTLSPKTRARVDIILSPSSVTSYKSPFNTEELAIPTRPTSMRAASVSDGEYTSPQSPSPANLLALPYCKDIKPRRSSTMTLLYDGSSFTRWSHEVVSPKTSAAVVMSTPKISEGLQSQQPRTSTTSLTMRGSARVMRLKRNSEHTVVDCKKLLAQKANQSKQLRYIRHNSNEGTLFGDADNMTVVSRHSRHTTATHLLQKLNTTVSSTQEPEFAPRCSAKGWTQSLPLLASASKVLSARGSGQCDDAWQMCTTADAANRNDMEQTIACTIYYETSPQSDVATDVEDDADVATDVATEIATEIATESDAPIGAAVDTSDASKTSLVTHERPGYTRRNSYPRLSGDHSKDMSSFRAKPVTKPSSSSPPTKRKLARSRTLTIKSQTSHNSTLKTLLSELEELEKSLLQLEDPAHLLDTEAAYNAEY